MLHTFLLVVLCLSYSLSWIIACLIRSKTLDFFDFLCCLWCFHCSSLVCPCVFIDFPGKQQENQCPGQHFCASYSKNRVSFSHLFDLGLHWLCVDFPLCSIVFLWCVLVSTIASSIVVVTDSCDCGLMWCTVPLYVMSVIMYVNIIL